MDDTKNDKLNKRALVVFFMVFSGILLPFSGLMLHDALHHNSESIKFITMSFHNVAAIVFTLSSIFHIKYNWQPIIKYIREKQDRMLKYRKEMAVAIITLTFLLLFALYHVQSSHLF